jgi:hypothetical protein
MSVLTGTFADTGMTIPNATVRAALITALASLVAVIADLVVFYLKQRRDRRAAAYTSIDSFVEPLRAAWTRITEAVAAQGLTVSEAVALLVMRSTDIARPKTLDDQTTQTIMTNLRKVNALIRTGRYRFVSKRFDTLVRSGAKIASAVLNVDHSGLPLPETGWTDLKKAAKHFDDLSALEDRFWSVYRML